MTFWDCLWRTLIVLTLLTAGSVLSDLRTTRCVFRWLDSERNLRAGANRSYLTDELPA